MHLSETKWFLCFTTEIMLENNKYDCKDILPLISDRDPVYFTSHTDIVVQCFYFLKVGSVILMIKYNYNSFIDYDR